MGTQNMHELPGNQLHTAYAQQPAPPQVPVYQQKPPLPPPPPRPQYSGPTYSNTPPPSYSVHAHPPPQQAPPQAYASPIHYPTEKLQNSYTPEKSQSQHYLPPAIKPPNPPYPNTPPAVYTSPQQQKNGYLGAPLHTTRSHSQPARVRFADEESTLLGETSSSGSSSSSSSDSDDSPRRHKRSYRHERRARDDRDVRYTDREREREREQERERDRDRERRHRHHQKSHHHHHHRETRVQEKEHKNRDTFLGAGAGTLIGDALFPGLGTAAGLLLGGYGGRKYAERSVSEDSRDYRSRRKDGYEDSDGEYRRRRR